MNPKIIAAVVVSGLVAVVLAFYVAVKAPGAGSAPRPVTARQDNGAGQAGEEAPDVQADGSSQPFDDEPVTEPVLDETPAAVPAAAAPPADAVPQTEQDPHAQEQEAAPLSPETAQAVRDLRKPTATEGQVTELPDGSKQLDLGNSAMSVPVATVGKDGKLHVNYHGEAAVQEQPSASPTSNPPAPAAGESQP